MRNMPYVAGLIVKFGANRRARRTARRTSHVTGFPQAAPTCLLALLS